MHAAIDGHPTLGVDGANLAIGARLHRSPASGRTGRCALGLMVARGLISTAVPGLRSATITRLRSTAITRLSSAAIPGLGSATITGLGSATIRALRCSTSSIATRLAAPVARCLATSVPHAAGLSSPVAGCLTSPVARVSASSTIGTRCAAGSTIGARRAPGSTIHSLGAMLRRSGMLRRGRMGCRSGMRGGRATAMLLRRSDCGYGENNQQDGPFTHNGFL